MYPVLFSTLSASNGGQAFGIFVLIFVVCFVSKGLEFLKNYLEVRVWNNPNYQAETTIIEQCECDEKDLEASVEQRQVATGDKLPLVKTLFRDFVRLLLCFLPELLSWAMMLVAMSFVLVYFFAVVTGMAFGRFFFENLSNRYNIRNGGNNFQGHH